MKPAHRTVIIHDLGAVGRTVNRPLQEWSDIGLSPSPGLFRLLHELDPQSYPYAVFPQRR